MDTNSPASPSLATDSADAPDTPYPNSTATKTAAKPADELQAKQDLLKKTQDQISTLNKTEQELRLEVTTLQAKVKEVSDGVAAYRAVFDPMSKRMTVATATFDQKRAVALAVLKEDKSRIDRIVADFDKALAAQAKGTADALAASKQAAVDAAAAKAAMLAAQTAYADVKARPGSLDASIKAAEGAIAKAILAETQADYAALYVLINDAQGLLPQSPLPSPEDLGAALQKAQDDAFAAQQAADKAQAFAAQAEQAAAANETVSSGKNASRTADLLAALKPSSGAAIKQSSSSSH